VFGSTPDEKIGTDAQKIAELARPALAVESLTTAGQVRGGGIVTQVTRFVDLYRVK
jgi:hypothetical protein